MLPVARVWPLIPLYALSQTLGGMTAKDRAGAQRHHSTDADGGDAGEHLQPFKAMTAEVRAVSSQLGLRYIHPPAGLWK